MANLSSIPILLMQGKSSVGLKSFEHITIHTLPLLYKSLVYPTLEYGNSIWPPRYLLDQQAVEKTQRRATSLRE